MLLFNFFFLSPVHTFTLEDSRNWFALAVYVFTAVVVSELAARARRRATEAEQREAETALLAEIATSLLQGGDVAGRLDWMGERVAAVLHAPSASIVLDGDRARAPNASPIELRAGGRRVGTLELVEGGEPNLAARKRLLPALASLLAVAHRPRAAGAERGRSRGAARSRTRSRPPCCAPSATICARR